MDARADDDLVARGPDLLDGSQGDDLTRRLAAVLLRRPVAAPGADLAVGHRLKPLDTEAVVIEAPSEHVGEKSVRVCARQLDRLHRAVSRGLVIANGMDSLLGHPPATRSRPGSPSTRRDVRWGIASRVWSVAGPDGIADAYQWL